MMSWPLTRSDCVFMGFLLGANVAHAWGEPLRMVANLIGFAIGTLFWYALRYGLPWVWRHGRARFWVRVAEVAQRRVTALQEAPPSRETDPIGRVSLADDREVVRLPTPLQRAQKQREGA